MSVGMPCICARHGVMFHIALLVRDVEKVADFYRDALSGTEVMRNFTESGSLRSIWVAIGPSVVMVEKSNARDEVSSGEEFPEEETGARLAVMERVGWTMVAFPARGRTLESWETHLARHGARVSYRTDWTLYAQDPENNVFGVSTYPTPIDAEWESTRRID